MKMFLKTMMPLCLGLVLGMLLSTVHRETIRDKNTAIIESCGEIADLLHLNADRAQRLSHYTDEHTERQLMCPECYGAEPYRLTPNCDCPPGCECSGGCECPDAIAVCEEVDTKPNATLLDDCDEILDSHARFKGHLINLSFSLEHALKGLRSSAELTPGEAVPCPPAPEPPE